MTPIPISIAMLFWGAVLAACAAALLLTVFAKMCFVIHHAWKHGLSSLWSGAFRIALGLLAFCVSSWDTNETERVRYFALGVTLCAFGTWEIAWWLIRKDVEAQG